MSLKWYPNAILGETQEAYGRTWTVDRIENDGAIWFRWGKETALAPRTDKSFGKVDLANMPPMTFKASFVPTTAQSGCVLSRDAQEELKWTRPTEVGYFSKPVWLKTEEITSPSPWKNLAGHPLEFWGPDGQLTLEAMAVMQNRYNMVCFERFPNNEAKFYTKEQLAVSQIMEIKEQFEEVEERFTGYGESTLTVRRKSANAK